MKNVYLVKSLNQEDVIIFSSLKKAQKWIENNNDEIFDKSLKKDLYITARIVF